MTRFNKPRAFRTEPRMKAGRFRGGKLAPVMAVPFLPSESGMLNQRVTTRLDPVAGELLSEVTQEIIAVYVPLPAIHALKYPNHDYPGNVEVVRSMILDGTPIFELEEETEISKRCGVEPRSISGTKMVSDATRLAHNAAVNYLRRRKYVNAVQLLAANTGMTPAIITQNVLDRLNAVLDPEDRVNGSVAFNIPEMQLPVSGIGRVSSQSPNTTAATAYESDGSSRVYDYAYYTGGANNGGLLVESVSASPNVKALLSGTTSQMSLTDFYRAELMDDLVRTMRQMVDDNPEYGEEMVARWAMGLAVDAGDQPFVLYEKREVMGTVIKNGMDGPNLDTQQSHLGHGIEFTVPVPATELGGIVITFSSIKPDETLINQPHPILSDTTWARNMVADEMAIDPVPVTVRDLYADCDVADEGNIMCYVGNNHMMKNYVNYGFTRMTDTEDVAEKSAIWQLPVPMSVTPENILYPEDLDHYPFGDQVEDVVTYTVMSNPRIATPIIFGPTPVEELAAIEDADIFEDEE